MARIRTLHDDSRMFQRLRDSKNKKVTSGNITKGIFKYKCRRNGCDKYVTPPNKFCKTCLK